MTSEPLKEYEKGGEKTEKIQEYELNGTRKKIVRLLLEDQYLSALKIAEQLGIGSRSIEKILEN